MGDNRLKLCVTSEKTGLRGGIIDFEEIARQGREIQNANQQTREKTVQKLMLNLSISRELAEYILNLESRIGELEQRS